MYSILLRVNILITINGESQRIKINNSEIALTLYDLKAGTYDVSVKYAGNYKYLAQTETTPFSVEKYTPALEVSAQTKNGKTIITTTTKKDATGNMEITYEGTTYTAEIINGVATVNIDGIIPGSHSVKVFYEGNDKYRANAIRKTIYLQ